VLDLSYAYLLLGYRLAVKDKEDDDGLNAWNFGPAPEAEMTVAALVGAFLGAWGEPHYAIEHVEALHHETTTLRLDSSRANERLGWWPMLNCVTAVAWTADWYRRYLQDTGAAARLVGEQLQLFEHLLAGKSAARYRPTQQASG
jgi:CDP-glucose 4,6-dehydratase